MSKSCTIKTWYEVVNKNIEKFAIEYTMQANMQDFPQTSLYLIGSPRQISHVTPAPLKVALLILFHSIYYNL
jgi:hypothetical protein